MPEVNHGGLGLVAALMMLQFCEFRSCSMFLVSDHKRSLSLLDDPVRAHAPT